MELQALLDRNKIDVNSGEAERFLGFKAAILPRSRQDYVHYAAFLIENQYHCKLCQTTEELIDWAQDHPFSMVFISWNLDGVNVKEISEYLESQTRCECIAFAENDDMKTAAELSSSRIGRTQMQPFNEKNFLRALQKETTDRQKEFEAYQRKVEFHNRQNPQPVIEKSAPMVPEMDEVFPRHPSDYQKKELTEEIEASENTSQAKEMQVFEGASTEKSSFDIAKGQSHNSELEIHSGETETVPIASFQGEGVEPSQHLHSEVELEGPQMIQGGAQETTMNSLKNENEEKDLAQTIKSLNEGFDKFIKEHDEGDVLDYSQFKEQNERESPLNREGSLSAESESYDQKGKGLKQKVEIFDEVSVSLPWLIAGCSVSLLVAIFILAQVFRNAF